MFLEAGETHIESAQLAEELQGSLASDPEAERLAHSVLEHDDQIVKDGKLLAESVDYAVGSFTPDIFFEQITKNYRNAQRLFGETIIRELTGYDPEYVRKNVKIREFQEKIGQNIQKNVERLKQEGLLDKKGEMTEQGVQLATLTLFIEELDHLKTRGQGIQETKQPASYGDKADVVQFRKQRYRDIDIRKSLNRAMVRGHLEIEPEDLQARRREQQGGVSLVFALDASGSMRGEKLNMSKKAGIALCYRAVMDQNDVGVIVFTRDIIKAVPATRDFPLLLREIAGVRAGEETDIGTAVERSIELFDRKAAAKHLILITDALPTRGATPWKAALEAAATARDAGITISLVGIKLEKEGQKLARQIVDIGCGKLYRVESLSELDLVILEDYEHVAQQS